MTDDLIFIMKLSLILKKTMKVLITSKKTANKVTVFN